MMDYKWVFQQIFNNLCPNESGQQIAEINNTQQINNKQILATPCKTHQIYIILHQSRFYHR